MDLSVIIVSFNVREYLKQCLQSVIKASENIDCEIFVVDNNSRDESCKMVEIEFPEVILIRNITNPGFSSANNQAIKMATGRYILLLNPDTLIEDDTLTRCIKFMDQNTNAGATGVRMVNGDGRFLRESKRSFPSPVTAFLKTFGFSSLFPRSTFTNKYYLPEADGSKPSEAEIISGAFMFIRSGALDKTGLLDEEFFMYGEDIDLSYRLTMSGYINYYFPETQIIHFKGKSTPKDNYNDILHFYKSMRIFFSKCVREGKYKIWKYIVIPGIYFRQALALLNRFLKINFKRL